MKRDIVGALLLLVLLVFTVFVARSQVTVTWRLVPVQQSVILPPASGEVSLAPGDTLVQHFSVPAQTAAFLTTPSDLTVNFTAPPGKTPPDVRMTLRNTAGNTLGNWFIPSAAVANHAVTLPIVDPQAGSVPRYTLEVEVPLVSAAGTSQGNVSLAYAPGVLPQGSSLSLSDRSYPGTLGLTISHDVSVWRYLAHYPSMVFEGRTFGSTAWLVAFQALWLLAIMAAVGTAAALVFRVTGSTGGPSSVQQPARRAVASHREPRSAGARPSLRTAARQPAPSKGKHRKSG